MKPYLGDFAPAGAKGPHKRGRISSFKVFAGVRGGFFQKAPRKKTERSVFSKCIPTVGYGIY